jgi:hypothetical protein
MLLFVLALSVSCDGGVFVRALVRDPRSVPIDAAEVMIKAPRREMKGLTDAHGCISVGGLVAPGRYKLPLVVSAAGYKTLRVPVPDDEKGLSIAQTTKSLPCNDNAR